MALWVETHHAADGHDVIADRIAALEDKGEHEGAALWRAVGRHYAQLRTGIIPIHGQPETRSH
ncbi:hypothetical protein [Erythrobacter sp.]|uniref:DUF6961 family protein n=1 Tax=Erythrobacter sp. TaxID=1042 RepID=UPI0025D475AF|nr:hypothetical protein [Erythrobacter sp.]